METSKLVALIVASVVDVPLILYGVLLLLGRGGALLAGWNTMDNAERHAWNKRAVFRASGIFIIFIAVIVQGVVLLGVFTELLWLVFALTAVMFIGSLLWVIYLNKSSRFKNR
jgi:hypothetical protein